MKCIYILFFTSKLSINRFLRAILIIKGICYSTYIIDLFSYLSRPCKLFVLRKKEWKNYITGLCFIKSRQMPAAQLHNIRCGQNLHIVYLEVRGSRSIFNIAYSLFELSYICKRNEVNLSIVSSYVDLSLFDPCCIYI